VKPKEHCFGAYLKEVVGRGDLPQKAGTKGTPAILAREGAAPYACL